MHPIHFTTEGIQLLTNLTLNIPAPWR